MIEEKVLLTGQCGQTIRLTEYRRRKKRAGGRAGEKKVVGSNARGK